MMVRLEAGGHPVHCRPLHYYSIDKDGTESVSVCHQYPTNPTGKGWFSA